MLHRTDAQLGQPAASPAGRRVRVVESFSSDRSPVAGDRALLDGGAGARRLDTLGTNVGPLRVAGRECRVSVGVRGQQTVAGEIDGWRPRC